ncbi:MAG TPA: N-acetylmuramoyl-L-alanine amidase [Caulobacteraceae bacterium]
MRGAWATALRSRWTRALLAVSFAGICAAAFAASAASRDSSNLLGVRFGGDLSVTRIVIDLDRGVSARAPAEESGPRRIVVDFPRLAAGPGMAGAGQGLVKSWSVESATSGARLALELSRGARIERRFLLPPADGTSSYRYVIDIASSPSADAPAPPRIEPRARAAVDTDADSTPTFIAPVALAWARKVVVIDAGHGGHDPGAQAANIDEKNVTLAAAKALRSRLERSGRYRVVMTRGSDVYVPLDERVQIARRAGADLFISLHADSAGPNADTHGASVYTLSERGSERVTQVLNRNEWFARTGARRDDPSVGAILLDLTQRTTRNRSAQFAQILIDRIEDRIDLLPRSHRDASYFVLLAPDVPAVLLEMGFISSPEDQARLTSPGQRDQLMDRVADAIDAYFAGQTRLASR